MKLKFNNDIEIIECLKNKQEIFINIFSLFNNNYNKLPSNVKVVTYPSDNLDKSLIVFTRIGRFYPSLEEQYIGDGINFINNNITKLFSLYGEKTLIRKMIKKIDNQYTQIYDYYVMKLTKDYYKPLLHEIDGYKCVHGNIEYYSLLKKLQYKYHVEEVYENASSYPYFAEMKSFKQILKNIKNFAVFTDDFNEGVSKCNINGESPDYFQLGGIYTKKEFRNQGMSKLCLTYLLNDIFSENHSKDIILYVKKENTPAIKLYEKFGFKTLFETTYVYY